MAFISASGVACLAMLSGYYGQRSDLADLRHRFGVSLKGATLKDVMRVADQIGLATRPMRLELGELVMIKTPCILHWDLNHFVVLKSVGRSSAMVHDPAVGARRLSFAEVSKHFTGVALEATPFGGFARAEKPPRIRLRQASAEAIIWAARRDSHFLETLRGIKAIKLFNAQDSRRAQWLHLLVETVNRQLTTQKLGILFRTANALLLGGLTLLAVWLGARQVLANAFSVGILLAFIAYKDQFLSKLTTEPKKLDAPPTSCPGGRWFRSLRTMQI